MRNKTLGAFEGVAAFAVVMIHCRFPGAVGEWIAKYFWFAVPFFFAVSGYFYYRKDKNELIKQTRRKIRHLLSLFLLGEVFKYIWYLVLRIRKYGICINAFFGMFKDEWEGIPFISRLVPFPLFNSVCWFILQLIITYAAWHFVIKKTKRLDKKYILSISFALIVLGSVIGGILGNGIDYYTGSYANLFVCFTGIPFFGIGYAFHMYKDDEKKFILINQEKSFLIAILLVGIVLIFVQDLFWKNIGPKVGHVFVVWVLFLVAFSEKCSKLDNKLITFFDTIGNKYSLYIYLFHVWLYGVIDMVLEAVLPSVALSTVWLWIRPIFVCIASAVFAVVVCKIIEIIKKDKYDVVAKE